MRAGVRVDDHWCAQGWDARGRGRRKRPGIDAGNVGGQLTCQPQPPFPRSHARRSNCRFTWLHGISAREVMQKGSCFAVLFSVVSGGARASCRDVGRKRPRGNQMSSSSTNGRRFTRLLEIHTAMTSHEARSSVCGTDCAMPTVERRVSAVRLGGHSLVSGSRHRRLRRRRCVWFCVCSVQAVVCGIYGMYAATQPCTHT